MASNVLLIEQVSVNLTHYNLWTNVQEHAVKIPGDLASQVKVLSGLPPSKLDSNDQPNLREWIIPRSMKVNPELLLQEINHWFELISQIDSHNIRPKRVTIGLVNDDGTVVYYFIHDGVVKPRQN